MNNKCPICNTEYQQEDLQFCPVCCWELVLIPSTASDDMRQWFTQKRKVFENALNSLKEAEKTISEKTAETVRLENSKKELLSEIKTFETKIGQLQQEFDNLNALTAINRDRFNQLRELEDNLPIINKEIETIKQSIPNDISPEDIANLKALNKIFSQY
jgi:chromosome segregation ATPase